MRLGDICTKEFLDDYRKRSIIIGKRIIITRNDVSETVQCVDIDNLGKLVVRRDNGEEVALSTATITLLD